VEIPTGSGCFGSVGRGFLLQGRPGRFHGTGGRVFRAGAFSTARDQKDACQKTRKSKMQAS